MTAAFADLPSPEPAPERVPGAPRHGVFVTLRDRDGRLRGCVGTLKPKFPDVLEETRRMAREAAFHDTRFAPVRAEELPGLRFEVSVLHPLEDAPGPGDLDPARFGVVVSTDDGRRGALLPAIEGVRTVAEQLAIARRKAGIGPAEPVRLQRFQVDHFEEIHPSPDPASGAFVTPP